MAPKKKTFEDLYSMYMFLVAEMNQHGFGKSPPEVIKRLQAKQEEVVDEMYNEMFGENPFKTTDKDHKLNPKAKRDGEYIIHTGSGPQSVKVE